VYSSEVAFDGWREFPSGADPPVVAGPSHTAMGAEVVVGVSKTWLGGAGWRRAGLIGIDQAPLASVSEKAPRVEILGEATTGATPFHDFTRLECATSTATRAVATRRYDALRHATAIRATGAVDFRVER
jgi:hypothetical protein